MIDAITLDDEITAWAEETFPRENPYDINPIMIHLRREWREFEYAITEWALCYMRTESPDTDEAGEKLDLVFEEAADMRILLTHLVGRLSGNLAKETILKFHKNKQRTWGEPDAFGVVEHIREPNI